jgi:hypothetical protein
MFGRTTNDIAATLMSMHDAARVECKHDQYAMARQMAQWMADDRRFDSVPDKEALAREAMDCRSHGRTLDLSGRMQSGATGAAVPGYSGSWSYLTER